jgi:hypothetical protein
MLRITAKQKAKARKRFEVFGRKLDQAKLDLVEAARVAERNAEWPEHLIPDGNDDAWFHRKNANSQLIEKRGGFSCHVATLALTNSDWETKETVAAWLRNELKLLREAEAKSGSAPVRRGKALSRTAISDLALELLECIGGNSLICLFQELLDVDRHRRSLADDFVQLNKAASIEAQLDLQGQRMGVRSFAHELSVSPSTVTRWRKSPAFLERVDFHKRVWEMALRDEFFDAIRKDAPALCETECFRRAFRLYRLSLPNRQAAVQVKERHSVSVAPVRRKNASLPRAKKMRRNSRV